MKKDFKIAIVDDHDFIRTCLSMIFKGIGFTDVFQYRKTHDLINETEKGIFSEIIFMDIDLLAKHNWEVVLWFKKKYPDVKIMALMMKYNEEEIRKFIKAGGNGFLFKLAEPADIKAAFKSLTKNGSYYQPVNPTYNTTLTGDNFDQWLNDF